MHVIARRFNSTRIGFIGAGSVHFGAVEGPWNHSLRLEHFANSREFGEIEVVAISDINKEHAQKVIDAKKTKHNMYQQCQVFQNWQEMINDKNLNLNTIFIGTPPDSRGSMRNNFNMELQCAKKGFDIFVEKPLSTDKTQDFIKYAIEMNDVQTATKSKRCSDRSSVICVGYMFRYHPAVQKMREILAEQPILHLNMRYQTAYPHINKQFWWDQDLSGGPIVEQGTHFVDIARYLCGECVDNTLNTNAVYYGENGGLNMIHSDVKLHRIKKGNVNQVITSANWKTNKGAVVSLSHGIHLHSKRFESYIEIWADGLSMCLSNPYDDISYLRVRQSSGERDVECVEKVYEFDVNATHTNDSYSEQIRCFLEGINSENNERNSVKSDYNDATYTYILTQDIQKNVMSKARQSKQSKFV